MTVFFTSAATAFFARELNLHKIQGQSLNWLWLQRGGYRAVTQTWRQGIKVNFQIQRCEGSEGETERPSKCAVLFIHPSLSHRLPLNQPVVSRVSSDRGAGPVAFFVWQVRWMNTCGGETFPIQREAKLQGTQRKINIVPHLWPCDGNVKFCSSLMNRRLHIV